MTAVRGARGSHAPSLLTHVRRAVAAADLAGARILVACSGGPDSIALLHALSLVRKASGVVVLAHGVDHGLRAEAAKELQIAADLATELGIDFGASRVALTDGGNLQARARTARYAALRAAAREAHADVIATAHTANDRAETLLMRLVRGTGPAGLGVLPMRAGDLFRPLIHATRADVMLHVERHRLAFAIDPSNTNARFVRARVRGEVMPVLESINPKAVQTICALADEVLALGLDASATREKHAAKPAIKKR